MGKSGGESLPLASATKASSATPSNGAQTPPRNAPLAGTIDDHSTGSGPVELKQNDTSSYKAITDIAELEKYISAFLKSGNKKKLIAYDSETTSLDTFNCNILGFSLCYEEGKAVYIPLQQESSDLFSETSYITKE